MATNRQPGVAENDVTANQILIGTALILVLAAGSQVLASRLRLPALIACCRPVSSGRADHRRQR